MTCTKGGRFISDEGIFEAWPQGCVFYVKEKRPRAFVLLRSREDEVAEYFLSKNHALAFSQRGKVFAFPVISHDDEAETVRHVPVKDEAVHPEQFAYFKKDWPVRDDFVRCRISDFEIAESAAF